MILYLLEGKLKVDDESNDDGINVTQILVQQENEQLKRRIDQMNQRIQTLIRDKERLLEISNHLRAQLSRHEGKEKRETFHFSSID